MASAYRGGLGILARGPIYIFPVDPSIPAVQLTTKEQSRGLNCSFNDPGGSMHVFNGQAATDELEAILGSESFDSFVSREGVLTQDQKQALVASSRSVHSNRDGRVKFTLEVEDSSFVYHQSMNSLYRLRLYGDFFQSNKINILDPLRMIQVLREPLYVSRQRESQGKLPSIQAIQHLIDTSRNLTTAQMSLIEVGKRAQ